MENFHTKNIDETFENFKTSSRGISNAEAKKRLQQNGPNKLAEKKQKSAFVKFLGQFKDVLIIVLLASGLISVMLGIVNKSVDEFVDAIIIFIVVMFNAVIGFLQERRSQKAMEALKNMTKPFCKVIRENRTIKIKTEDIVAGDIVVLEAGDIVPADLRLIETNSLKIEESALTGESVAVEKNAFEIVDENAILGDQENMAFMGSVVTYGRGKGVAVATGMNTQMGSIATALEEIKPEDTPMTKRLKKTSLILTIIVLVVCLLIFIVGMIIGETWFKSFEMAIAVAVCAIPEGLPACNTVTMSMGVKRMSEQRAIVKTLPAVETLGSTEVICTDKTGTLTLNKMTVQKVFYMGDGCEVINKMDFKNSSQIVMTLDEIEQKNLEIFKNDRNFSELLRCMILCNDSKIKLEDDKLQSIGDPTEIALVHFGYKLGVVKEKFDGNFKRLNEIPFDSNRKLMTTINQVGEKICVYTKGAVDSILSRCDRVLDNGKIRRLTNADREKILEKNSEFASEALRNLAFAFKTVEQVGKPTSENTEVGLCFLGLVGMIDPPRVEVKDAIKTCKEAGIVTVMITGDHKDTAFAIAKELGICNDPKKVVTGAELNEMSDEEFVKKVKDFQVYARVSPQHKVRIVNAFKANDKIVAMTGDGVNDAPSIKAADIGVGMGITGTDVTKESADMILTDDNFATIVGAVKEGRRVYSTLLKILMFLLGTSFAELIVLAVILLVFRDSNFFSPILLLWINFVSDTFVGLALGFEKCEKDIMKRKPIKNRGNMFTGSIGFNIIASALFQSITLIMLYCVFKFAIKASSTEVSSICFVYLCFVELLHAYNLKSETNSLFSSNPFDNKWLNIAFAVSAILAIIIVAVPIPFIQNVFNVTTLNWWQWLVALGCAFAFVPYFELVKWFIRLYNRRKKRKNI